MHYNSRRLLSAILLTGALVTLSACGGSDGKDGGSGSSDTGSSSTSGASGDKAAASDGDADQSAAKGSDSGDASDSGSSGSSGGSGSSGSAKGGVSLPAAPSNMKVAASGNDASGGHKTVFYSITDGDGTSALGDYEEAFNSAGYVAEMPDENTLEASKGGVELELTASTGWTMNDFVTLQVKAGSIALPSSPQEADIVNSIPEMSGDNSLIAAGGDADSGKQVAFYNADGDFMDYLKRDGTITSMKQDGEAIENYFKYTKVDGTVLTVETIDNALVGSLAIFTPAD